MVRCMQFPALAIVLATASCGGGGGSSQARKVATKFSIAFPPAHSMTSGTSVTMRGSTTNGADIASLQVNGIFAASADGFANWTATLALPVPTNSLRAIATDRAGRTLGPLDRTVELSTPPVSPGLPALDPNRRQLLLGQGNRDPFGLVALDVPSGRFLAVSGPTRGSGAPFTGFVMAAAVDAAADTAYVLEFLPAGIRAVDLATGDRVVLSDDASAGPKLDVPEDLDLESGRDRLLVADRDLKAIFAVSLADGSRSILSDATHGSGPTFALPVAVCVVASQGRALVADLLADALFSVDLITGARSIVSDDARGSGAPLSFPDDVTFDPASGDALVVNAGTEALMRVDLVTGDRTIVSDRSIGDGAELRSPSGVTMLEDGSGRAALVDSTQMTIFGVDLATGDRDDLETLRIGAGQRLGRVGVVARNAETGQLFAAGFGSTDLHEIEPSTGDRAVVASATRGAGPVLEFIVALAVAPSQRRALVADLNVDGLIAVDLFSGDRTILSDDSRGSGPTFDSLNAVAVDESRNLAIVMAEEFGGGGIDRLLNIDLATGDRSELSGPGRGAGTAMFRVESMALTADGITLYAVDTSRRTLFRVDRVSGDRTIVADSATGSGPTLSQLQPGIVLADDETKAWIVDFNSGLLEVDLATGNRIEVAGPNVGSGPQISGDLAPGPAPDRFFSIPFGGFGVLEVDLVTGDRVVISH